MTATVTTQSTVTMRGHVRWAYCINRPGEWPFVSDHRFHSETAARAAGDRDAAELAEYERAQSHD